MPADPRDDFGAFAGSEHFLTWLRDPYAMIREAIEDGVRHNVADTIVDSIATFDVPYFVFDGPWFPARTRSAGGGADPRVTCAGFCVALRCAVRTPSLGRSEILVGALTVMMGRIDKPGRETMRVMFDPHGDFQRAFNEQTLKRRFHESKETVRRDGPLSRAYRALRRRVFRSGKEDWRIGTD
jgi:hypothetical protein